MLSNDEYESSFDAVRVSETGDGELYCCDEYDAFDSMTCTGGLDRPADPLVEVVVLIIDEGRFRDGRSPLVCHDDEPNDTRLSSASPDDDDGAELYDGFVNAEFREAYMANEWMN